MLAACGAAAAALRARATAALRLVGDGRRAGRSRRSSSLGDVWDEPRVVDFRDSPAQVGARGRSSRRCRRRARRALSPLPAGAPDRRLRRAPAAGAARDRRRDGEPARAALPGDRGRGDRSALRASRASGASRGRRGRSRDSWPRRLRWLLAATLVLYAIQASYSEDVSNAIENIGFFLVPFAILFVLLAEVEWSRAAAAPDADRGRARSPSAARWSAIYQYFARDLFLNPELFDANQLHVYFRVNSIFFDPNVFGRYLALAMTALGACIAWGGERRDLALAAARLRARARRRSRSATRSPASPPCSPASAMVAVLRWRWRGAPAFAALGAVALVALVIAGGTPTSDIEDVPQHRQRAHRPRPGGLMLFGVLEPGREPPADQDVGAGRRLRLGLLRPRLLRAHRAGADDRLALRADHGRRRAGGDRPGASTCALLVARWSTAARARRRRARWRAPRSRPASSRSCVDSLGYTGFAIDPATWALLGARRRAAARSARAGRATIAGWDLECSSTCAASRPRAPRTRPRACSRS